MTCIVGLAHKGKVYIGGDSAGVAGWSLAVRNDPKVFRNGEFIFGFTSSFRMGQLLHHSFVAPEQKEKELMAFLVTDFVNAVRECLKTGGFAKKTAEVEEAGTFLFGYRGRLFKVCDDYQVCESAAGFDACGCAIDIALGAMYANKARNPRERITNALEAAESFSAGVRGPFNVVVL